MSEQKNDFVSIPPQSERKATLHIDRQAFERMTTEMAELRIEIERLKAELETAKRHEIENELEIERTLVAALELPADEHGYFIDPEGDSHSVRSGSDLVEMAAAEIRRLKSERDEALDQADLAAIVAVMNEGKIHGCHDCGEERPAVKVNETLVCPECHSENITCIEGEE